MIPKVSSEVTKLAIDVIELLECYLENLGYQAVVHFEIEGCYASDNGTSLDFDLANKALKQAGIQGTLVREFWHNQWEFVSNFAGQTPLQEAHSVAKAIKMLPQIFNKQGINQTIIAPVVWNGDSKRMVKGSRQLFTHENRQVHIPNAIQLNVSINNAQGNNIIARQGVGQRLQQCFINSSASCALLYLPEPMAFERLLLKEKYGLDDELCSPSDISGGHQGSVALYLDKGKHNQLMGETPLLYDQHQKVILSDIDWRKTARVEYRLGASSRFYNPYINVVYALLNVIDALTNADSVPETMSANQAHVLPRCLEDTDQALGAISQFARENWFAQRIDEIEQYVNRVGDGICATSVQSLGARLKQVYLAQYQQVKLIY